MEANKKSTKEAEGKINQAYAGDTAPASGQENKASADSKLPHQEERGQTSISSEHASSDGDNVGEDGDSIVSHTYIYEQRQKRFCAASQHSAICPLKSTIQASRQGQRGPLLRS